MVDNRPVWATLITSLLSSAAGAHALSCKPRSFTLAEAYEQADSIIVGQVTECEQETSTDRWTEGGSGCAFDSLEVLKESASPRDYRGVASSAACGLALHVGHQYLLFLDSNNQPLPFSATLMETRRSAQFVQLDREYLRVLREYRDGAVDDLSEPWVLADSETSCSISHVIDEHRVVFGREKADGSISPTWTREFIDGKTIVKGEAKSGGKDSAAPLRDFEVVIVGMPEYPDGALTLDIVFDERQPAAERRASITVGDQTWSLFRTEQSASFGGVQMPTMVRYMVAGNEAEQIFSAMKTPTDFTASAVLSETIDPAPPASQSPEPTIRLDTRSTQLAAAIDQFERCSGRKGSVSEP